MAEQTQSPEKTIIGKVLFVSSLPNNRYGISFGHKDKDGKLIWFNGFGKCPVAKGEDVEMTFVETPEGFKNIKRLRAIKIVGGTEPASSPESTPIPVSQPETVSQKAQVGEIEQPLQGEAQPPEFKCATEVPPLQERASIADLTAAVKNLESQIASVYSLLSKEYEKIDGLIESVALLKEDLKKVCGSKGTSNADMP